MRLIAERNYDRVWVCLAKSWHKSEIEANIYRTFRQAPELRNLEHPNRERTMQTAKRTPHSVCACNLKLMRPGAFREADEKARRQRTSPNGFGNQYDNGNMCMLRRVCAVQMHTRAPHNIIAPENGGFFCRRR